MYRVILILIIILSALQSKGQDINFPGTESYADSCQCADTLLNVTFSCGSFFPSSQPGYCITTYDDWQWFDSFEKQDSLLQLFRRSITPYIGELAASRTFISTITFYQEPSGRETNSLLATENPKEAVICNQLAYIYDCFLLLDDSVWFPMYVLFDNQMRVMNPSELPSVLTTKESFKLMPICEIYQRVSSDPYVKDEDLSPYCTLFYSAGLKLFYYEFICYNGELIEKTPDSWTTKNRHIFINAHTGKILWRTTITRHEEHGPDVIIINETYPPNRLTGH